MQRDRATIGVLYGLATYLAWGLCPIYFKAVAHVPPAEVLAHRIVWSLFLLVVILSRRRTLAETARRLRERRLLLTLAASTVLVAINWFTFIWSVTNDRLLEASLGYFINPLVNVLLGMVFLRERLRPLQWVSLALAAGGVALMAARLGGVPTVSLVLAFSFGLYGLLRKVAPVGGVAGLTVETVLLVPLALAALFWWESRGTLVFGHLDRTSDLLLVASGAVTAFPLIWFANAARRLRYATVGFLQYLAPSGQFLLAVMAYHEPFGGGRLLAFAFIWTALAIYSLDTALAGRRRAPAAPVRS